MPPRISNPLDASKIDVAILCGGLGTRLKNVINDRPKSMAEINGTPFLDLLIDHIAKFGFKHFILCTGHMGETIENRYAGKKPAINIEISREIQPLGTGGALKNGSQLITSNPFLVVNGDSFCAVDLKNFVDFHIGKKSFLSICTTRAEGRSDCGTIQLDTDSRILRFSEKAVLSGTPYVNAGIYLFSQEALALIPSGKKASLEYELFPSLAGKAIFGYYCDSGVIDIGTPERYQTAQKRLQTNKGEFI